MSKSKKSRHKQDPYLRKLLQDLFNPKLRKKSVLGKLRDEGELNKIIKITDSLSDRYKIFDKYIYFNPLPQSYSEVRKADYLYLSNYLEGEINWLILSLRKYAEQLNNFIIQKENYETNLLLGEYEKAREILKKIKSDISHSIWGIENELLLNEYQYGLEKNKELLSKIHKSNEQPEIQILSYYLSDKAEMDLPIFRYIDETKRFLNDLQDEELREYFTKKLDITLDRETKNLLFFISYDSTSPIIDRYLLLKRMAQLILSTENKVNNILLDKLETIAEYVDDDDINFILDLKRGAFSPHTSNLISPPVEILDSYLDGKFEDVMLKSKQYLLEQPGDINVYDLYIKSLVQLDKGFISIVEKPSILDLILKAIFNILNFKEDFRKPASVLLKYSYQLSSLKIGTKLHLLFLQFYFDKPRIENEVLKIFVNRTLHFPFNYSVLKYKGVNSLISNFKESKTSSYYGYLDCVSSSINDTEVDKNNFPNIYLGTVYYSASETNWKNELKKLMEGIN